MRRNKPYDVHESLLTSPWVIINAVDLLLLALTEAERLPPCRGRWALRRIAESVLNIDENCNLHQSNSYWSSLIITLMWLFSAALSRGYLPDRSVSSRSMPATFKMTATQPLSVRSLHKVLKPRDVLVQRVYCKAPYIVLQPRILHIFTLQRFFVAITIFRY